MCVCEREKECVCMRKGERECVLEKDGTGISRYWLSRVKRSKDVERQIVCVCEKRSVCVCEREKVWV